MVDQVTLKHIPRDASVTVGTDNTILSQEVTAQIRQAFFITNASTGGQIVYLGIDKDAVSGQGLVLYPGGVYSEVIDAVFRPSNGILTAISNLAGAVITIHERIGDII
jgi:hypothetical protein